MALDPLPAFQQRRLLALLVSSLMEVGALIAALDFFSLTASLLLLSASSAQLARLLRAAQVNVPLALLDQTEKSQWSMTMAPAKRLYVLLVSLWMPVPRSSIWMEARARLAQLEPSSPEMKAQPKCATRAHQERQPMAKDPVPAFQTYRTLRAQLLTAQ